MRVLVCYDIPSDPVRDKVAKWLDGFGERVQYSVFEAELDAELLDHMWAGLLRLVDPEVDRVAMVPVCAGCGDRRRWLGQGDIVKWAAPAWVV